MRDLVFGEGGAHGGDYVVVAMLVGGDDIHVAFDDDAGVGLADGCVGAPDAVEGAALVEDGSRRGVDILWIIARCVRRGFGELATAEAYDIALPVVDGEHEPVAEEVPCSAVFVSAV